MFSALVSLLMLFSHSHAAEPSSCTSFEEYKMGVNLKRTWFATSGVCMLSVSPADAYKNLIYRDYSLSTDGMFMVFNLYGNEGDFGVRDFFMFPRTASVLSYQWKEDTRELLITHVTGDVFTFNADTAQLKSISGATVKVSATVSRSNRGGVEVQDYKGLLLDTGFTLNQDPAQNSKATSSLKKSASSCSVQNKNLFRYMSDGDIVFRYQNDKDFFTYVKSACPKLK
ncbi:hypothetical protein [Bdellovibrio sp. BCCA]|uniref:hypothetical protein n=1 Tax=Bdellovibrio sp. BCCA TaxID=3136281 RepID=UPI0030F23D02